MKTLILAVLLLGVCCLEGAVVEPRPEGPEGNGPPQTPDFGAALQEYTRTLTQFLNTDMLDQLKNHAQTFADQFQTHLKPLTDQMRDSFTNIVQTVKESVTKNGAS